MKKSSKILISFISVAVVALIAVSAFLISKNGVQGFSREKTITFTVIMNDKRKDYTLTTKAKYLRDALEEKTLVVGIFDDNGMFVTGVDGVMADAEKGETWVIRRGSEDLEQTIDLIEIKNGEKYIATLENSKTDK